MKNYNQKIENFLNWLKDGENGDERFVLPSRELFDLYRMENPEVKELTEDESKYLSLLYKAILLNKAATVGIKPEIAKLVLGNDYGYVDRPKQKEEQIVDSVFFDTSELLNECTTNHNDESLENEAVKGLEDK